MTDVNEEDMHSDDAELALLGAVAYHPDALASVLAGLPGKDFYDSQRGIVWDACRALSADRKLIDPTTIARWLITHELWSAGVRSIVERDLLNAAPASQAYAQSATVADYARKREIFQAVKYIYGLIGRHPGDASDVLAAVRAHLDTLSELTAQQGRGGTRTWAQMLAEFEEAHKPGETLQGIPTPWTKLDRLIGGFFGGRLYVIGGSAGDGKSTAALNIAHHAATLGHPTLVFSKEMPVLDVFSRVVAAPANVELGSMNRRELSEFEVRQVRKYAQAEQLPLRVNADHVNLAGMKTIARGLRHKQQLDLLVVDYLQLIDSAGGRTQEEEIAKASTALKQLAMELDVPLIVPAQLNRAPHARADARPTKADLRGSGRIEQDADAVVLLHHPVDEKGRRTGEVTFILDKNRHGPRGEFNLTFNGGYGAIA